MLEDVIRGIGFAKDDVLSLQSLQRGADILRFLDDEGQQTGVETAANRGRRLQERAIFWRQPIHPGGEQTLHARRQTDVPHRGVEVCFARFDAQRPIFDQEAQDLLAKQRIARGALGHLPGQRVGQGRDAEPRLREVPDVACGERFERERRHAGAAPPAGNVFGTPRLDNEQVGVVGGFDQFAEQLFRGTVDPVNVLEHENHRGGAASRSEQRRQEVARA